MYSTYHSPLYVSTFPFTSFRPLPFGLKLYHMILFFLLFPSLFLFLSSILFYFYSIPFCFILFYSILFYSILSYPVLFYSILFYSILFYSILFYSILFYSILFYSILFYSILFYSILFYSIPCRYLIVLRCMRMHMIFYFPLSFFDFFRSFIVLNCYVHISKPLPINQPPGPRSIFATKDCACPPLFINHNKPGGRVAVPPINQPQSPNPTYILSYFIYFLLFVLRK